MMRDRYLSEARAHLPAAEYQRLLRAELTGYQLSNVVVYEGRDGWTWKVRTDPTAKPLDLGGGEALYSLRVLVAGDAPYALPLPSDTLTAPELLALVTAIE